MCIIIARKANAEISKEIMFRCFERNPHGAGIAFSFEKELYIQKGYFNPEELWRHYSQIPPESPTIIHFRYASHGEINPKNCHPWMIDKNHCMVHNGTLYDFITDKTDLSDTGLYTKLVLKPLFKMNKNFWRTAFGKYLLQHPLGNSKMVILSNNGEFSILNENYGLWENNCWYSNDGFREESEYCGTCYPRQLVLNLECEDNENDDDGDDGNDETVVEDAEFELIT